MLPGLSGWSVLGGKFGLDVESRCHLTFFLFRCPVCSVVSNIRLSSFMVREDSLVGLDPLHEGLAPSSIWRTASAKTVEK